MKTQYPPYIKEHIMNKLPSLLIAAALAATAGSAFAQDKPAEAPKAAAPAEHKKDAPAAKKAEAKKDAKPKAEDKNKK